MAAKWKRRDSVADIPTRSEETRHKNFIPIAIPQVSEK
jgi:hypothetical protein